MGEAQQAQLARLMLDIAQLGQRNPVSAGLSEERLEAIAGWSVPEPRRRPQEDDLTGIYAALRRDQHDPVPDDDPEELDESLRAALGPTKRALDRSSKNEAELEDRKTEGEVDASAAEERAPRHVHMDAAVLDAQRKRLGMLLALCVGPDAVHLSVSTVTGLSSMRMNGGKAARAPDRVSRAALDVVLAQLLLEQDVVLHRALLHNNMFEPPTKSNGGGGRRKRGRRRNSSVHDLGPSEVGAFVSSVRALVQRSVADQSHLGMLLAVKGLLCLFGHCVTDDSASRRWQGEDAALAELDTVLGQPLARLSGEALPAQNELLDMVARMANLEAARRLGLRTLPLAEGDRLLRELLDTQPESWQRLLAYGEPPTVGSLSSPPPSPTETAGALSKEAEPPPPPPPSNQNQQQNQQQQQQQQNQQQQQQQRDEGQRQRRRSSRRSKKKKARKGGDSTAAVEAGGEQEPHSPVDEDQPFEAPGATLAQLFGRTVHIDNSALTVQLPEAYNLANRFNPSVEHTDFRCDGCKNPGPLVGLRLQCAKCEGFDLCLACFQEGKHDASHPFWCYPTAKLQRELLPPLASPELVVLGMPCVAVVLPAPAPAGDAPFFEVEVKSPVNELRMGWSSAEAPPDSALGSAGPSWALDVTRRVLVHEGKETKWGSAASSQPLAPGGVVSSWIDLQEATIHFAINGEECGAPIALGAAKAPRALFPAVSLACPMSNKVPTVKAKQAEKDEESGDEAGDKEGQGQQENGAAEETEPKLDPAPGAVAFNVGQRPFRGPKAARVRGVRAFAQPSVLCVPRSPGSGARFVEDPAYSNCFELLEDYTIEAMVFWDPPAFGTEHSRHNRYTILSRLSWANSNEKAPAVTCLAIVADGHLYFRRHHNETVTPKAVIIPRRWHHVSITYYGGSYRSSVVNFTVDGVVIKSEWRKSPRPTTPRRGHIKARARPIRDKPPPPPPSADAWGIGALLATRKRRESEPGDPPALAANNDSASDGADDPPVVPEELNSRGARAQRCRAVVTLEDQLSGCLAEVRVWNKALLVRQVEHWVGRSAELTHPSPFLLFRFTVDEATGRRLYASTDSTQLQLHNFAALEGDASMDATVLSTCAQPGEANLPEGELPPVPETPGTAFSSDVLRLSEDLRIRQVKLQLQKYRLGAVLLDVLGRMIQVIERIEAFQALEAEGAGTGVVVSNPVAVCDPHVLTFLTLHSILRQATELLKHSTLAPWIVLCSLKLLRVNLSGLRDNLLSPSSVGLGPSPTGSGAASNVIKLRTLLLGLLDHPAPGKRSLKAMVEEEILACLGESVRVFYPAETERRQLFLQLFSGKEVAPAGHVVPTAAAHRERLLALLCEVCETDTQLLASLVVRPEDDNTDDDGAAGSAEGGAAEPTSGVARGPRLRWRSGFVKASLSGKHSRVTASAAAAAANANVTAENTLTKRKVIHYMQRVAPAAWLESNKLHRNEMVVTKTCTSDWITKRYLDLETKVASGELTLAPHDSDEGSDAEDAAGGAQLEARGAAKAPAPRALHPLHFAMLLLEHVLSGPPDSAKHAKRLLGRIQQAFFGVDDEASHGAEPNDNSASVFLAWSLARPWRRAHDGIAPHPPWEEPADEATPASSALPERWWERCVGEVEASDRDKDLQSTPVQLDAERLSRFLWLSKDGMTCVHESHKNWGTVLAKRGFAKGTGVHEWQVEVRKCNSKRHMFVGLATRAVRTDSYLGNDRHGFGVLLAGDVYTDAQVFRRGVFPRETFGSGSVIALSLDTSSRTLVVTDAKSRPGQGGIGRLEFCVADLFDASRDGVLYPAICTYEKGDSAQAFMASQVPRGHWMLAGGAKPALPTLAVAYMRELITFCADGLPRLQARGLLEDVLLAPLATLLRWPSFDLAWVESVHESVRKLLQALVAESTAAGKGPTELEVLLGVLAGRLYSAMVLSEPLGFERRFKSGASQGGPSNDDDSESSDGDANASATASKSQKAQDAALTASCNLTLLSRGLDRNRCQFAESANYQLAPLETHAAPTAGPAVSSGGSSPEAGLSSEHKEMIHATGPGKFLFDWVSRHLNFYPSNLQAFGAQDMRTAINAVIVGLLHHTGWLSAAYRIGLSLERKHAALSQRDKREALIDFGAEARPDERLLDVWRTAMDLKAWLVRFEKDSNQNDGTVATQVLQLATFLLDLKPCCEADSDQVEAAVARVQSELKLSDASITLPPKVAKALHSPREDRALGLQLKPTSSHLARSRLFRSRFRSPPTFRSALAEVSTLVQDVVNGKLSVARLHVRMLARRATARCRERGFKLLSGLLSELPLSAATMPLHCAVLCVVPSALRRWVDAKVDCSVTWHYLRDLESCSAENVTAVSDAFAELGHTLAKLLQASTAIGQPHGVGLLLAVLDTLGVRIDPIDHEMLSQTQIFEALHRVMELSRDSITALPSANLEERRSAIAELRIMGRAAMKTFYLLCSQVAVSSPRSMTERMAYAPTKGFSLLRMRSGPESLNTSVFSLLFREIRIATEHALDAPVEGDQHEGNSDLASDGDEDALFAEEAAHHLTEITALLLSVSSSRACQAQLATEEWLSLLCTLAEQGPAPVRTNVFVLFGKIMPGLTPEDVRIDLPGHSSFGGFLLSLVARAFHVAPSPLGTGPKADGFQIACQAMSTLRLVLASPAWRPGLSELLITAFRTACADLQSASLSDGQASEGAAATDSVPGSEFEPYGASALELALAALSVLTGSLVKLAPGAPVAVFHLGDASGVYRTSLATGSASADVAAQEVLSFATTTASGQPGVGTAQAAQILPLADALGEQCAADWFDSAVSEAVVELFAALCGNQELAAQSCAARFKVGEGQAAHDIVDSPEVGRRTKIGSVKQGEVVRAARREGNWIQLEQTEAQRLVSEEAGEAWMLLQDPDDDYLLCPEPSLPVGGASANDGDDADAGTADADADAGQADKAFADDLQRTQTRIASTLALKAAFQAARFEPDFWVQFLDKLSTDAVLRMLEFALEPVPGVAVGDVDMLEERLCVVLEEQDRRIHNPRQGEEQASSKSGDTVEAASAKAEDSPSEAEEDQSETKKGRPAVRARARGAGGQAGVRQEEFATAVLQIMDMGFPRRWAEFALMQTHEVTSAISFICSNGEVLDQMMMSSGFTGQSGSAARSRMVSDQSDEEVVVVDEPEVIEDSDTEEDAPVPRSSSAVAGPAVAEASENEDFLEMDGMDTETRGSAGATGLDPTFAGNAVVPESAESKERAAGAAPSFVLPSSVKSALERHNAVIWGPCADSRSSYQALVSSYSLGELIEEANHIARTAGVLRSRMLVLSFFARLAQDDDRLRAFLATQGRSADLRKQFVALCDLECFRPFHFHGLTVLRGLVHACRGGASAGSLELSLADCLSPCVSAWLQADALLAEALLETAKQHMKTAVSADIVIETHLAGAKSLVTSHPLWFVDWATGTLLRSPGQEDLCFELYKVWLNALRSPSTRIKGKAIEVISGFLDQARGQSAPAGMLRDMLALLPTRRIRALAARAIWREADESAGFSPYVKALVFFTAKLRACAREVGVSATDASPQRAIALGAPCAFVELREASGQVPGPIRAPWTVSLWLWQPAEERSGAAVLLSSVGASNENKVMQLLSATESGGFVGLRTGRGKELSLGYRLPRERWVLLTLVCSALTQVVPGVDGAARGLSESQRARKGRAQRAGAQPRQCAENGSWEKVEVGSGDEAGSSCEDDMESSAVEDDEDDEEDEEDEDVDSEDASDDSAESDSGMSGISDESDSDGEQSHSMLARNVDTDEALAQFLKVRKRLRKGRAATRDTGAVARFPQGENWLRLYVDGELQGSARVPSGVSGMAICEIGSSTQQSFVGQVKRVCVWRSALAAWEVRRLAEQDREQGNAAWARVGRSPLANPTLRDLHWCWNFDDQDAGPVVVESTRFDFVGILRQGAELADCQDTGGPPPPPTAQESGHGGRDCAVLDDASPMDNPALLLRGPRAEAPGSPLALLRREQFREGFRASGVITWEPERYPDARSLLLPRELREAFQPVDLVLGLCEEGETGGEQWAVKGTLELRGKQPLLCAVRGSLAPESGAVEFSVQGILRGNEGPGTWVEGMSFHGSVDQGELTGAWEAPFRIPALDSGAGNRMHVAPSLCSMTVSLLEGGTVAECAMDAAVWRTALPRFVCQHRRGLARWAVLVLEVPGRPLQWPDPTPLLPGDSDTEADAKESTPTVISCPACTCDNEPDVTACIVCNTPLISPDEAIDPERGALDCVGSLGLGTGRFLWEFEVIAVGSNEQAPACSFGVCEQGAALDARLGSDGHSWCLHSNGEKEHNGNACDYLSEPLRNGDVVGVLLDTDDGTVRFVVNSVVHGPAFTGLFAEGAPVAPCFAMHACRAGRVRVLGLRQGVGRLEFAEPGPSGIRVLECGWSGGREEGFGRADLVDGAIMTGCWQDGRQEGVFERKTAKGEVEHVCFARGEPVAAPAAKAVKAFAVALNKWKAGGDDAGGAAVGQATGAAPDSRQLGGALCASAHALFTLDPTSAGDGINVSPDCLSAMYLPPRLGPGQRGHVLGSRGFSRGKHYWEVKIGGMQWGSTYVGVSERPTRTARHSGSGWGNGYGFVNYRATHGPEGEQLYGSFYAVGDVVGVLLDMDRGRLHFFKDSKDYQSGNKQVVVDLGLAYSGVRQRFAASNDGRGPTFYPCFGFSKRGDKMSLENARSVSVRGLSPMERLDDLLGTIGALDAWPAPPPSSEPGKALVAEASGAFARWHGGTGAKVFPTVGRLVVEISQDPEVCRAASPAALPLVPGDRLNTERGPCEVLGTRKGAVWYIVSGMDIALFWTPRELAALVRQGQISRSEEPSLGPSAALHGGPVPELSADDVRVALSEDGWTVAEDAALVLVANRVCDRYSVEPERLPLHLLAKAVKAAASGDEVQFRGLARRSERQRLARFLLLVVLNTRVRRLLPLVNLNSAVPGEVIYAAEASASKTGALAETLGRLRGLVFTRVKLWFWDDLIQLSTTPTIPAPDEYDPPPDFPHVKVNRIRASGHLLAALGPAERLKRSVFGQLMLDAGIAKWSSARLRRSYSHVQDASQKRCFFVKFQGEGVDDHGGPYRAVFQIAIEEEAAGALKVLVPCPNASEGAMENADKLVFNSGAAAEAGASQTGEEKGSAIRDAAGSLQCALFLGRLVGVAVRHEIHVGLSLPALVWGPLTGQRVGWKELHEIDSFTTRSLRHIEMVSREDWEEGKEAWTELLLEKVGETQGARELLDEAGQIPFENRGKFIELVVRQCVLQSAPFIQAFARGLSDVIPVECFRMFSPAELEALVCGAPDIDIGLLKQATEYVGVDATAPHVGYFWEALEAMTQEERSRFINFVCARSRLPSSLDKFPMLFKITLPVKSPADASGGAGGGADAGADAGAEASSAQDEMLPHSQTCFFSLSLPEYSSMEVCLQKLNYAANNCNTMEDFDVHDARGFEGM